MLSSAVLVLASTGVASAQQTSTAAKAAPEASAAQTAGPQTIVNFGYRSSWADGDEARWERYRDLRDGILVGGSYNSETANSALGFNAANVGYHDQRYAATYNKFGKLKVSALWNSIPLNYAYNTLTPWQDQGDNVWTLDQATRTSVQNKTPGVLGIGSTGSQFNQASIYRGLATPFEMQSRRDVLNLGMKYRVTDAVGVNLGFNSAKRGGTQPFGGSFAFNNGNERPVTLDDRTNDMTAAVEWAKPSTGMLRVEWLGSRYKNEFTSLTWDNPLRATDFSNGKAPPLGPYDPSGYSNGNGPAFGRLALPPSNSMNTLSVVGLRKLPGRSTLNGQFSFTSMKQDEELIPWTTNSVIASPIVIAAFPHLAQLPRSTAEAEVRAVNALLNFTTRPTQHVAVDMRYRFNDRESRTPVFDAEEYVRFDAVPEELGGHTEQYNIRRNTFETGATFTMLRNSSIRLGYILDDVKRDGRAFGGMRDHTFRVSFDTYGNQYFMVRGIFENTRRNGSDFSAEAIEHAAAQPGLRFYDEAELGTNKGTLILQVTPNDELDLGLSLAAGKDDYDGDGHEFGLLDNSNASYNVSVTVYPAERVTVGGNYGYEKFSALMKSRNASPLSTTPGAYESWTDPGRDWSVDNDETVKNLGLYLDVIKALPNTNLRFNYDRSESDNAFIYGGARVQALSTNIAPTPGDAKPCGATSTSPCFTPLPDVTNTWQQLKVDLTHMFRAKYGVSLGYSFEKLDITDFATQNLTDGSPRIDPLGSITTGYGNRPYKGQTFMVRFIYMFQPSPVL
jgi:MtrB/PioB family decaheme-associated outer membrane protein